MPWLMRAVHGTVKGHDPNPNPNPRTRTLTLTRTLPLTVRMLAVLREPSHRLYSAYYFWPQYRRRYGAGGAGFVAYIQDTLPALRDGFSAHGPRLCARSFEGLDQKYEQVGK